MHANATARGTMAEKTGSHPLWQEITLALVLKGMLLAVIWYAWFSTPDVQTVDENRMAAQLLSSAPYKEPAHGTVPGTR